MDGMGGTFAFLFVAEMMIDELPLIFLCVSLRAWRGGRHFNDGNENECKTRISFLAANTDTLIRMKIINE
jgi:hypothetical protein